MLVSPYILPAGNSVRVVMTKVLIALLPGIAAYAWFFGPGIWVSLLLCSALGLLFEALAVGLRGYPLKPFLGDGSVLVTAWLLALSLPTLAPWWLYVVGMLFAVIVAKHLYGGLGQNPFNPAMVGFAVLMVSFPAHMTHWPGPVGLVSHTPDLAEAFRLVFAGPGAAGPDAYTSATPLDTLRTQVKMGASVAATMQQPTFGYLSGKGAEAVVLLYLLGGLFLLGQRIVSWHIPLAFLATLAAGAGLMQLYDAGRFAGPLFHLMSGGAMLGAFFILTDPVSACTTPRGKLIYGALAGLITVLIRNFGSFPEGVAFAVLLMNMAAPFLDTRTQPRVFGQVDEKPPET